MKNVCKIISHLEYCMIQNLLQNESILCKHNMLSDYNIILDIDPILGIDERDF